MGPLEISLLLAVAALAYPYGVYPLLLVLLSRQRPQEQQRQRSAPVAEWPRVTISLPVHNEADGIGAVLEDLLRLDYPPDRIEIVVVSDASTDGTDEVVGRLAGRDPRVRLKRLDRRSGKTVAENAALSEAAGDIVVNVDATVRLPAASLRPLVGAFVDPSVGVASGTDRSVSGASAGTAGESAYVRYEMWIRRLETSLEGIVGSSGCFFATRKSLRGTALPPSLSWDFAAPLRAREAGFRSVAIPEAVCYVPRSESLRAEYRRKVRTMARGIRTLAHERRLLNPIRYGRFAWMLFSHKVARWAAPWLVLAGLVASGVLGIGSPWGLVVWSGTGLVLGVAVVGWRWPEKRRLPRLLALVTYGVASNIAAMHAALEALRSRETAVWTPTRRAGLRGARRGPSGVTPG